MEEIIKRIFEYIIEERELPEDLLYVFSKETTKIIQSREVASIPKLFWELENYVGTFWRGGRLNYVEKPYIIYQMGRLLSFTNMICMMADEKEKELSIEDYAIQWQDQYLVFKFVHEQKGITHQALAKAANISPSNLSQFMIKVKWDGFFNCRLMGQEKHYYLTNYGEQLYEFMEKKTVEESPLFLAAGYRMRVIKKYAKQFDSDNMTNQEKNNNWWISLFKRNENSLNIDDEENEICKALVEWKSLKEISLNY